MEAFYRLLAFCSTGFLSLRLYKRLDRHDIIGLDCVHSAGYVIAADSQNQS
jgi:hypothetical protein